MVLGEFVGGFGSFKFFVELKLFLVDLCIVFCFFVWLIEFIFCLVGFDIFFIKL